MPIQLLYDSKRKFEWAKKIRKLQDFIKNKLHFRCPNTSHGKHSHINLCKSCILLRLKAMRANIPEQFTIKSRKGNVICNV